MKKLLAVVVLMSSLLQYSYATEIPIVITHMTSGNVETYKKYLWHGYNNAFSFFLDDQSRKALFNLGMHDIKDGKLSLMSAQKATYLGGFPYVAHAAYTNQPCYPGQWIIVKHCGYVGDQEVWVRAFNDMFNQIQQQKKAPLACAVIYDEKNLIWIKVITDLGFIACPELGNAEGCKDCIWYVRPFQEAAVHEHVEPEQNASQQVNSCLSIV